jgi:hypothetical protein
MPNIPIAMAKEGMILSKPVVRANSSVAIAGEGVVLTQEYIDRFKTSGVSMLSVRGPVPGVEEALDFKKLLATIDDKFKRYNDDKFMNGMRLLATQYFQRKLEEQQAYEAALLAIEEPETAAQGQNEHD